MNKQPTYTSLEPRIVAPFTPDHRAQALRNNRSTWKVKMDVLPDRFDAAEQVDPAAIAALYRAFTLAKTSHDDWRSFKREGRFDFRQAARATRGNTDVFKRRTGASTTKVKCSVLIDASGSMRFGNTGTLPNPVTPGKVIKVTAAMAAAVFGVTIAKALGRIPTVDLDVYQHAAGSGRLWIKYRWAKGTPVAVFNESINGIEGAIGGNADGHALFAITAKMLRDLKRDERGLIMIVSDGLPSEYANDVPNVPVWDPNNVTNLGQVMKDRSLAAGQALIDAVAYARKNGIEVIAVAIDGSDQSTYYGAGNTIPFTNDWTALGSALAKRIGTALARR